MSESLVGRAVASTRQNAGSVIGVAALVGANGPAGIGFEDLIVMLGIVSAARFAHDVPAGAAGVVAWPTTGSNAAARAAAKRRAIERASWAGALYRRLHRVIG